MKLSKIKRYTGDEIHAMRKKFNLNQFDFWLPIGVTQSGGSRYENGRTVPTAVQMLLAIKYGTAKEVGMMGDRLASPKTKNV